jgi:hypothetical protein
MEYVITDSEGNTLDTYRDEREAERALLDIVAEHPADSRRVLLIAYADDGSAVGDARLAEDVRPSFLWRKLSVGTGTNKPERTIRLVGGSRSLTPSPREPAGT